MPVRIGQVSNGNQARLVGKYIITFSWQRKAAPTPELAGASSDRISSWCKMAPF